MKRIFNIYDGLFLMALYFKITGTGLSLNWFEVFIPYIVEAVAVIITAVGGMLSWQKRLEFYFWKIALFFTVRKSKKKAIEALDLATQLAKEKAERKPTTPSSNPGQYRDPDLRGQ